jgi:hypothetical protein
MTVPTVAVEKANRKKPKNDGTNGKINGRLARL